MNFQIGARGYAGTEAYQREDLQTNSTVPRRTLREQIQAQIAFHRAKISDLESADEALSPEVERALNALSKL